MKKKYYAEHCTWGVNVSYDSMGGGAYDFYAFPSKAARDAWVEENEFDCCSRKVAGISTRRAVERCCGSHFALVEAGKGMWVCCRRGTEGDVEMQLLQDMEERE